MVPAAAAAFSGGRSHRLPAMMAMALLTLWAASSTALAQVYSSDSGGGIGCFVCSTVNGSNKACEDPFDSSQVNLTSQCSQGRRNQGGLYPARYCFKLKGTRRSDGLEVLVRRCSIDPLVSSVMKSHCGSFKVATDGSQQHFEGCVTMCRFDGCNAAARLAGPGASGLPLLLPLLLLLLLLQLMA